MQSTDILANHIAIIPDGNRRWAKKHAIAAQKRIYEKGSDTTLDIIEAAFRLNVPYVTFWGSSFANLQARARGFVAALEEMMVRRFLELAEHPLIHEKHVRVEVLGEWRDLLRDKTIRAIEKAIDATASYNDRRLTILVGYDGRHERGAAIKDLANGVTKGLVTVPQDVIEADQLLRSYAWTGRLPDVDLVIRTGAWEDPHLSAGFLSFLTSESQFAFPQVLWPDFTPQHLSDILHDFAGRERRMGV